MEFVSLMKQILQFPTLKMQSTNCRAAQINSKKSPTPIVRCPSLVIYLKGEIVIAEGRGVLMGLPTCLARSNMVPLHHHTLHSLMHYFHGI